MARRIVNLGNGEDLNRILEPLVDGKVVKGAYIVRLEEGLIAGWPIVYDDELIKIIEQLSIPMENGLYVVIGGFF